MHVADVIRMNETVLEKRRQESRGGESLPADEDLLVAKLDTDSTAGGDRNPPVMSCSKICFPIAAGGHSGGNKVDRSVNVGVGSPEPTGVCSKKPVS